ncbi:HEAT repeat domain-containing protein [Nevskia soli]|uniref:HEAT repeat domain-containing protein n=1 Tax=Nevskia soli TaxID=418856 RepID=UPI00068938C9|nr:HEAT repeat domain-containing protein [Nevskia soli]
MPVSSDSADLARLQALLDSADGAVRLVAVREVTDACALELLPVAERALDDAEAEVRLEAVTALDAIGGAEAITPLIRALGDADNEVRELAAKALAENKSPEGAGPLLDALAQGRDVWTVAAFLEALKPLRNDAALQPALRLLSHADAGVRAAAVGVIGYLRLPQALPELVELGAADTSAVVRQAALRALVSAPADALSAAALRALGDTEWSIRAEAAAILGKLRYTAAVDALIGLVDFDPQWQVREQAAEALGLMRHRPAVQAIGRCLDSPVSNLRKSAVIALDRIGDRSACTLLLAVREDPDAQVRKLTAQLIEKLTRARAV